MLSNMACSLIEHKRINTTVAKAKALRVYIEPIITRSKTDSTHSRRMVFRQLKSKEATAELFRDVAPLVASRPGGYTRIIKTVNRLGDNAEMCMIELVDFNELMKKDSGAKKSRSRRRGGKKAAPKATTDTAAVEEKVEDSAVEVKDEAVVEEAKAEAPKAEEKKVAAPKAEKKEAAPKAEKKDDSDKKES